MKKLFIVPLVIFFLAIAFLSCTEAITRTYTTNFPLTENPIWEGGNWISGQSVGLDWKNVRTSGGLACGTQTGSGGYDDSTAILAGSWGADQWAQATVHTVNQSGNKYEEVELRLRTSISAHSITGYEINCRCLKTSGSYCQIVRWNGPLGSFTYVAECNPPSCGVANGDVMKATIVGSTITLYINGSQVLQGKDSTYTSGSPGIGFFNDSSSGNSDFGFSSFTASDGDLSIPSPPKNLRILP